jgi:ATPase subunit of ABC transporter with duplicated ATPase domains
MISAANVTIQFGEKPLFEDVSVKFANGNRYGLIGANGSGKTTFLKILSGELEPTHGNVSTEPNVRVGKLRQDQFAFEQFPVLHTVIMGHARLWELYQERERLYSKPSMSEAEGLHAAEVESEFASLDGYSAESAAGELLLAVGIPEALHTGPMSAVAPGWKLRVLLAQALFADPDVMLLDEPTNNLDIDTIRWLEGVLTQRKCTMVIISHDRHFLNTVCTHMADLDYGELRLFPGNYDEYMIASTQAREQLLADSLITRRRKPKSLICKHSLAGFPRTPRSRGKRPRGNARSRRSSSRRSSRRAARARTSASSRTKSSTGSP